MFKYLTLRLRARNIKWLIKWHEDEESDWLDAYISGTQNDCLLNADKHRSEITRLLVKLENVGI